MAVFGTPTLAQDANRMDSIVRSFADHDNFMGVALVANGNAILFRKAYGAANLESEAPNTPETKFRIASLTKQFTAAAVLLLEERSKLKLSDSVGKLIPDAPPQWASITVHDLMSHTSGMGDIDDYPDLSGKGDHSTLKAYVSAIEQYPLQTVPGTSYHYSNLNYIVLGYIVERASGLKWETFLAESIFSPLGMADSGYETRNPTPNRASGYVSGKRGLAAAGKFDMTTAYSAGGLYSTVDDLLKWETGLYLGHLLSASSLGQMTTLGKGGYGLGIGVGIRHGQKVYSHEGLISGFSSYLAYYPSMKCSVIVLSNVEDQATEAIGAYLSQCALGENVQLPSERVEIKLSQEALLAFIGKYRVSPSETNMISLENGHLVSQISGRPKFQLSPQSPESFFIRDPDRQFRFQRDSRGDVAAVIMTQGDGEWVSPRED